MKRKIRARKKHPRKRVKYLNTNVLKQTITSLHGNLVSLAVRRDIEKC